MYGFSPYINPDPARYGFAQAAAKISAASTPPKLYAPSSAANNLLLDKEITLDDADKNNILVTDSINVLSPLNSPFDGKKLFSDTKPPSSVAILDNSMYKFENSMHKFDKRMEKLENQFGLLQQTVSALNHKFYILLAPFQSHMHSASAVSPSAVPQIVQDSASANPTTPSDTLPVSESTVGSNK
jgi:hypothetical protein